jgi:hypothetical protein
VRAVKEARNEITNCLPLSLLHIARAKSVARARTQKFVLLGTNTRVPVSYIMTVIASHHLIRPIAYLVISLSNVVASNSIAVGAKHCCLSSDVFAID